MITHSQVINFILGSTYKFEEFHIGSLSVFSTNLDVIKGVRKATAMFIEDGAAYPDMNFRYVLVPFNDPGIWIK